MQIERGKKKKGGKKEIETASGRSVFEEKRNL